MSPNDVMDPESTPPLASDAPTNDAQAPQGLPLVVIPLSPDDETMWKGEIKRAREHRKIYESGWQRNLRSYIPDAAMTDEKWGDEINPGVDFYQVEQKKAQLFYETPTVVLSPEPDQADPSLLTQISQWGTQLNRLLGNKGLNTVRLFDKVLFDILCPAGMGIITLGITRIERPVTGTADPTQTAPFPVYQRVFAERISPKQFLPPKSFRDSEFDKAPWLAEDFAIPLRTARRELKLPDDWKPSSGKGGAQSERDQHFALPGDNNSGSPTNTDIVTGTRIWYKAALYDDTVWHPDWLRELVFVDSYDGPCVHRDCVYQTFDPTQADFTPDSLRGFPIHPITIRDLADSPYVPSDCTVTRPLVKELSLFRTQMIDQRDASTSIRLANEGVITPEILTKIVRGPHGSLLMLPEAEFNKIDPAHPPIIEVAKPNMGRESFESQNVIESDIAKVTTLGANQAGEESEGDHSATEMTYVQRNANVRLNKERNRVLAGFLAYVAKVDPLLKQIKTQPGQPPPPSGYTYDIKPDSGVFVDAAAERKFAMDRFNFLAKDPFWNGVKLRQDLAPKLHLDPSMIQPPPPPGPETPKTTFVVKGEDLSPLAPQYANVLEILGQEGIKLTVQPVSPEMIENAAQTQLAQHPATLQSHGTAPKADTLSKHASQATGQTPHFGGQAGPA